MTEKYRGVIWQHPVRFDRAFSVATSLCLLFLISSLSGITPDSHNQLIEGGQGNIDNPIITSHQMTELSELRTTLRTAGQSNNNHSWTWAYGAGSGWDENGADVAIGPNGELFFTGFYEGAATFGTTTLFGGKDAFLVKMQPNGTYDWALNIGNHVAGPNTDRVGYAVDVDASGNAYIVGETTPSSSNTNQRAFIAKFDQNGTLLWHLQDNSTFQLSGVTPESYARGVAVDSSGAAYITGHFKSSIAFGNHQRNQTTSSSLDGFIFKINPDGTSAWAKKIQASSGSPCMFIFMASRCTI